MDLTFIEGVIASCRKHGVFHLKLTDATSGVLEVELAPDKAKYDAPQTQQRHMTTPELKDEPLASDAKCSCGHLILQHSQDGDCYLGCEGGRCGALDTPTKGVSQ